MPDLWCDCDTAVTVPVNIAPLVDSATGAVIQQAIVYNFAGLSVQWNFQTATAFTSTAVTPTTGGDTDWIEPIANVGMYSIEIPASGGGTINNNTEGVGWFTGSATAVLPWRGPTIGFRRAALNDLFMEGSTASTNLEDFFDGTGYVGGTAKLTVDVTKIGGQTTTAAGAVAVAGYVGTAAADTVATVTAVTNGVTLAADAITAAKIADNAFSAEHFAAGCIDNATFAADVGTTTYASNPIAVAVSKAIANDLDTTATAVAAFLDHTVTAHNTADTVGERLNQVETTLTAVGDVPTNAELATALGTADDAMLAAIAALADETDVAAAVWANTTGAAVVTELAKVPKSDSTVSWNTTALAAINAEVDTALNTAIPGSPTSNSINERVKAIDDLTQASGTGDLAALVNTITDLHITDVPAIKSDTGTLVTQLADIHGTDLPAVKTDTAAVKVVTDLLAGMYETDGAVKRWTANSLELGPSGSGGNGSGLTAIPWNAAWDAEVQSECADALAAYDPPTATEMTSAFTEIKGATWAGTDTLEAIHDDVATMQGNVTDILTDTGTTLDGKLNTISTAVVTTIPGTLAALATTADVADAVLDEVIGTHAGVIADIHADVATLTTTVGAAGAGLTSANIGQAAIVANNLDHLCKVADADDVVDNSIVAKLAAKGATADWSTYANTTDSLEANRDNIGTTGAGLSTLATVPTVTSVTGIATGGITSDSFAAGAITAAAIADAAIDNATFAADVGSTALATNKVATAAAKAWDAAVADHVTAATFGKYLGGAPVGATVAADIADLHTDVGTAVTDIAAVHVHAGTIEADVAAVHVHAGTIEADTNELQVEWADGGRLDLILDSVGLTSPPTAAAIADAVWDELVTGHDDAGKAGAQLWTDVDAILADTNELEVDWKNGGRLDVLLDGAASAGDPWITEIPGAYTGIQAGNILGTRLAAVYGSDEKAAIDLLDDADGGLGDIHTVVNTVNANVATAMADIANVHVHASNIEGAVITEVADLVTAVGAIKTVTDALPTLSTAVDAIWDESVESTHQTSGTAGKKLDDAGAAADPWTTLIPGDYTAGMAGKILGDNINAPIATVDTVVDGIATQVGTAGAGLTAIPWNAAWDTEVQSEATDALNAFGPPTKTEMDAMAAALPTAASTVAALLDHDYTAHTTANTVGKFFNALRTLVGHKSTENEAGTSVSYKATDDSTESGTMSWDESGKTRGRYTGW